MFGYVLQVEQRDVPGIDCAYLAMDTEEGVEVVWNEVQFSERKNFKAQEEKIQQVFENLTQLEHPNIVKFHRYWTDTHNDKPRVKTGNLKLAVCKSSDVLWCHIQIQIVRSENIYTLYSFIWTQKDTY